MSSKAFIALIALVTLSIVLLIGNTILPAAQSNQPVQKITCPFSNPNSCCQLQTKTHKQTSPAGCTNSCCKAQQQAGNCPSSDETKTHPEKCPKSRCTKATDTTNCPSADEKSCTQQQTECNKGL